VAAARGWNGIIGVKVVNQHAIITLIRHKKLMMNGVEGHGSWTEKPQIIRPVVIAALGPDHRRGGRRAVVLAEKIGGTLTVADAIEAVHGLRRRIFRIIPEAVCTGTILALPVLSPAIELITGDAAAVRAVIGLVGDGDPVCGGADLLRRLIVRGVAEAVFAGTIISPAVKRPARDATAVGSTAHADDGPVGGCADLLRRSLLFEASILLDAIEVSGEVAVHIGVRCPLGAGRAGLTDIPRVAAGCVRPAVAVGGVRSGAAGGRGTIIEDVGPDGATGGDGTAVLVIC
jgi:hypothetical protein